MTNLLVDLNYDICSKSWKLLERVYSRYSFPPIIEGILRAAIFTLKSLSKVRLKLKKNSIIFLVGSHNQNQTLSQIAKRTDNSILLGFHNYRSNNLSGYVPSALFYLMGWLCFPYSLYLLFRVKDKYQRVALVKRMERVLVSGVSILVWRFLYKLWKPVMIVVSNDHNHWTRSAIRAAKKSDILTSYIPHAYTSDTFPELECDYSFLDSNIQKKFYKKEGKVERSIVEISGAVRYEKKIKKIKKLELKGILVCFNLLDSQQFIESMICCLTQGGNKYNILIKPHPGDVDRFKFIEQLCCQYLVEFIPPDQDIYNYSNRAQILLGGVTGAHIDALMYGMLPMSFHSWYEGDYYGLIREGIINLVRNYSEIELCYENHFNEVMSLRHNYNAHLDVENLKMLPSEIIAQKFNILTNV